MLYSRTSLLSYSKYNSLLLALEAVFCWLGYLWVSLLPWVYGLFSEGPSSYVLLILHVVTHSFALILPAWWCSTLELDKNLAYRIQLSSFFFLGGVICFFLGFFGHTHSMEVPRPGIESDPQLWPMPYLQQCQILNPLCQAENQIHTSTMTQASAVGCLTHYATVGTPQPSNFYRWVKHYKVPSSLQLSLFENWSLCFCSNWGLSLDMVIRHLPFFIGSVPVSCSLHSGFHPS